MARSNCLHCGGTGQIEESYNGNTEVDTGGINWRFVSCYNCSAPSTRNAGYIGRLTDIESMRKTIEFMALPREELERYIQTKRFLFRYKQLQ
jgi:hypothetical protein